MLESIRDGQLPRLERLVLRDRDLERPGPQGERLLCVAVDHARVEIVDWLLARGVDPNTADGHGWTPAMLCTRNARESRPSYPHAEVRRRLEAAGATFAEEGEAELWLAARRGDLEGTQSLLRAGAPCDPASSSSLIHAAAGGHLQIVQRLLGAGAQLERVEHHATALCRAAQAGRRDVAEFLAYSGANAEPPGCRGDAAYFATRYGHPQLAQWLEQHTGSWPRRRLWVSYEDAPEPPGWPLLMRRSEFGGSEEYSILLVHAPIERVSPALHVAFRSERQLIGLDTDPPLVFMTERSRYVIQLCGCEWTMFVHQHGNIHTDTEAQHLVRTLSSQLGCRAIHAAGNDSGGEEFTLLDDGVQLQRGPEPTIVTREDIRVPAIDPWGEWGPTLLGVGPTDVARVDALVRTPAG